MGTAKKRPSADPDDGVHVHQHGVASCHRLGEAMPIFGFVTVVEQQLVGVAEPGRAEKSRAVEYSKLFI
jgi:hypothetical protein